tara:strand:+ start:4234 stop:4473 length:240 start_codon:yes stop_codon:yes gene_type:complete
MSIFFDVLDTVGSVDVQIIRPTSKSRGVRLKLFLCIYQNKVYKYQPQLTKVIFGSNYFGSLAWDMETIGLWGYMGVVGK